MDAVARARPMAHRPAVLLRPTAQVRRLELAAEVLPGVQREELPVQAVVSERPSELLLVEQAAVAEVPWAQQPVAVVELLSEVRVVEAELPSAERAAAEAQRAAVPAAEEERLAAERVVEAVQPSAGQAAVPVQPSEVRAELPSAEPSVRSDRPARVRLVR
ncbi:hypothetical protein [Afipia sp. DC4300-2b1]|uniref:hypothetical protein n=1 Tax=Afipia sp. DC4300-2b1 TaxID=2804672 RepID=UPI003CEF9B21